MLAGVFIMTVFATVWAIAAQLGAGLTNLTLAAPVLISAGLLVWAVPILRRSPVKVIPNSRRTVALWSSIEVILIVVAIKLLGSSGHNDAIMPVIAIIVGAHFLPLARGLSVRSYYWTGGAIMAMGVLAFILTGSARVEVTGWVTAVILWVSAVAVAFRAKRLRPTA